MSARVAILCAAVAGLLGVGFGAFGAHGLRERLSPELMAVWRTAVEYQFWHALALLAVGVLMIVRPLPGLSTAAWAFVVGLVLFSGSLYLLALSGQRWLGVVTPFGGLAFLIGWAALIRAAWRL